ncbi:Uncharacterised protein [Achromobacter spanius]|uniref:hypothetical protein n=1 Tax=Achromobacter spanius TaxID=217203 RepID=UPI000C2B6741|nr:hypothetical protein [Achromobacter spanius]AUA58886.1 hypothetical protein CVS48_24470 [Achromobacter spanius]CAB3673563.1 hypothetical protein LMG5911_03606 [Achromobacter spanius]VEE58952.1 Uncharacterised protein [Achromobacter spanius]
MKAASVTAMPSIDMMVFTNRAFDIACTLDVLSAALPDDKADDPIPTAYIVRMLAGQARTLADQLFELPFVLLVPAQGGEKQ